MRGRQCLIQALERQDLYARERLYIRCLEEIVVDNFTEELRIQHVRMTQLFMNCALMEPAIVQKTKTKQESKPLSSTFRHLWRFRQ